MTRHAQSKCRVPLAAPPLWAKRPARACNRASRPTSRVARPRAAADPWHPPPLHLSALRNVPPSNTLQPNTPTVRYHSAPGTGPRPGGLNPRHAESTTNEATTEGAFVLITLTARAPRVRERAEPDPTITPRLNREQVIDRIIQFNRSAKVDFLESFDDDSLSHYLDHLVAASAPRGPQAVWTRRGDTPAIMSRGTRH